MLGDTGLFGTILSPAGGDGGAVTPPDAANKHPSGLAAHRAAPREDQGQWVAATGEPTSDYLSPEADQVWQQLADDGQPSAAVQPGSPQAIDQALEEMLDEAIAATARMVALL